MERNMFIEISDKEFEELEEMEKKLDTMPEEDIWRPHTAETCRFIADARKKLGAYRRCTGSLFMFCGYFIVDEDLDELELQIKFINDVPDVSKMIELLRRYRFKFDQKQKCWKRILTTEAEEAAKEIEWKIRELGW